MTHASPKLDDNVATLAAAAAFERVRKLEAEGLLRAPGLLQCCVKLDGSAVVWAGRDLEDARLRGSYGHEAVDLDPWTLTTPKGARRLILVVGTVEVLGTLPRTGYHDGDSRPFGPAFREVPR